MEDSGAILCQISSLKDMLDQFTGERGNRGEYSDHERFESEIVKCSEFETPLAAKESDISKSLYVSQFELIGLVTVTKELRNSVANMEEELDGVELKRPETLKRIHETRERFIAMCMGFQKDVDSGSDISVLRALLSEKEYLENEMHILNEKNKMMAFIEGILEDLNSGNSALQIEIHKGNEENEKLLKDIY